MLFIWSGWGILVAVFFVIGFALGIPIAPLVSDDPHMAVGVCYSTAGLVSGLGSFLLARKIEAGKGRIFIEEATQKRFVYRKHAGSLFFIPTRYWAGIAPIVGVGLAAMVITLPPLEPRVIDPAAAPVPKALDPAEIELAPPEIGPVVATSSDQPV